MQANVTQLVTVRYQTTLNVLRLYSDMFSDTSNSIIDETVTNESLRKYSSVGIYWIKIILLFKCQVNQRL